jgi:hypothetical protein
MTRSLIVMAAMALAGCGKPAPSCTSPTAEGVVRAVQPRTQFRAMLTQLAERTQTVRMAMMRDPSRTPQRLAQAVDKAVEKHGAEWEHNLVGSWGTLNAAELKQVCEAVNGRDQSTFMRFAERIGSEVQSRNEPLLKRAGVEVLDTVWTQTAG